MHPIHPEDRNGLAAAFYFSSGGEFPRSIVFPVLPSFLPWIPKKSTAAAFVISLCAVLPRRYPYSQAFVAIQCCPQWHFRIDPLFLRAARPPLRAAASRFRVQPEAAGSASPISIDRRCGVIALGDCGTAKTAITASPMYLSSVPPLSKITSVTRVKYSFRIHHSPEEVSLMVVKPRMSANVRSSRRPSLISGFAARVFHDFRRQSLQADRCNDCCAIFSCAMASNRQRLPAPLPAQKRSSSA